MINFPENEAEKSNRNSPSRSDDFSYDNHDDEERGDREWGDLDDYPPSKRNAHDAYDSARDTSRSYHKNDASIAATGDTAATVSKTTTESEGIFFDPVCSASLSAKDSEFSSSSRVDSRDTLNREGCGRVSDKDVRYSNQRRTGRDDPDSNESRNVRFRCIVAAKEGAIIIGARGRNIKVIKDMGVYVKVSPYIASVPERVVTMSGPLDRIGDAIYYMAERMTEPYTGSQRDCREGEDGPKDRVSLRACIPSCKMGYLIGKGGSRIKELQNSSGAEIYSEELMLGNSTEKSVMIRGDPRAIQIAVYTIVSLVGTEEVLNKLPHQVLFEPSPFYDAHPPASQISQQYYQGLPAHSSRGGGDAMYWDAPNHHQYNNQHQHHLGGYASNSYNMTHHQQSSYNQQQHEYPPYPSSHGQYSSYPPMEQGQVVREIEIPDEFAAKIIGKGGANAKELRARTGSDIKIYDREPGKSDRLVHIFGTFQGNEMAVGLIMDRIMAEQQRNGGGGGRSSYNFAARDRVSYQPYSIPAPRSAAAPAAAYQSGAMYGGGDRDDKWVQPQQKQQRHQSQQHRGDRGSHSYSSSSSRERGGGRV